MTASAGICPRRIYGRQECRGALRGVVTLHGAIVWRCDACDRHGRGLCRTCPGAVVGRAIWCDACRVARRREMARRIYAADKRANRRKDKQWRAARKKADPEGWAKVQRERSAAYRAKHPDRIKKYKRREALARIPSYVAAYQRWNKDPERAEKKRAQARARYYELHPVRPSPMCRDCGTAIPYRGSGRPRARCERCWMAQV